MCKKLLIFQHKSNNNIPWDASHWLCAHPHLQVWSQKSQPPIHVSPVIKHSHSHSLTILLYFRVSHSFTIPLYFKQSQSFSYYSILLYFKQTASNINLWRLIIISTFFNILLIFFFNQTLYHHLPVVPPTRKVWYKGSLTIMLYHIF